MALVVGFGRMEVVDAVENAWVGRLFREVNGMPKNLLLRSCDLSVLCELIAKRRGLRLR